MVRSASLPLALAVLFLGSSTARAQSVLFSDDFENGAASWITDPYWHVADASAPCLQDTFPSGTHCMWYGREDWCDYQGLWEFQNLHLASTFYIPTAAGTTSLEFWSRSEVESDTTWDTRSVDVSTNGGVSWTHVFFIGPSFEPWTPHAVDLSVYAGQAIQLRFSFWAGDGFANDNLGWLVDDVVLKWTDAYPSLCAGDGTSATCPCSNAGASGRGCENSVGTGGAKLDVLGDTSPDTIVLRSAYELPSALTIFLQGPANILPVAFGDGLRCTGGSLKRLYVKNAVGGVAIAPALGDPSVSQRSATLGDILDAGSRRYYQTYYRDPNPGFCPPPQGSYFNASQMRRITW